LTAVIEATDGGAAIRGRLAALGLRHAALGVTPAHYPPVAAALVDALARAAGPGWKPAHAHTWTALIGEVVEAMLSGAANDDDTA